MVTVMSAQTTLFDLPTAAAEIAGAQFNLDPSGSSLLVPQSLPGSSTQVVRPFEEGIEGLAVYVERHGRGGVFQESLPIQGGGILSFEARTAQEGEGRRISARLRAANEDESVLIERGGEVFLTDEGFWGYSEMAVRGGDQVFDLLRLGRNQYEFLLRLCRYAFPRRDFGIGLMVRFLSEEGDEEFLHIDRSEWGKALWRLRGTVEVYDTEPDTNIAQGWSSGELAWERAANRIYMRQRLPLFGHSAVARLSLPSAITPHHPKLFSMARFALEALGLF